MVDRKKVLLIEDEESIQEALKQYFSEIEIDFKIAINGEVGLKMAMDEKPDLILLDVVMPKMHGIDMLDQLQADEAWGSKVPVIILTNYGDDPKVQRAVKAGRAELMQKTQCKISDVVDRVKEKLSIS